jgi:hypothetical protein
MNIPTYSSAQAITLVAVANLQYLATHACNLFLEERCTRAADNLVRSLDSGSTEPAGFSEDEIALAVEPPTHGASDPITALRRQGLALAEKAITNVKRTVRRQFGRRCSRLPEGACDSAAVVENGLECRDLVALATAKQRDVLAMRLSGHDDEWIADELGTTAGNVAVLAHRGVNRIRGRLRATVGLEEWAA